MANRTIIVEIKALVNDISSKLKSVTGDINKFAQSNKTLSHTFGLLSNSQKATIASMKQMTDGQKAVTKGFLDLSKGQQSVAAKFAKLDDTHKAVGASYKKLSAEVVNGTAKISSSQQKIINQWKSLPAHVKGAITAFHNQDAAAKKTIAQFASLDTSVRKIITGFANLPYNLKQSGAGLTGFSQKLKQASSASASFGQSAKNVTPHLNKITEGFRTVGKGVLNFNNLARTATSSARAIGTSMIFAGGAFRDLGVGINVVASLFQTLIPMFGHILTNLSRLGPIGIAIGAGFAVITAQLVAFGAAAAAIGIALFKIAESGISFNAEMETTQISIATLITQFKDLYEVRVVDGKQVETQIGAYKQYTDAQLKAMKPAERAAVLSQRQVAIGEELTAAIGQAKTAFAILSSEAAQSPFTTKELASGFQAVIASLGQYGVTSEQAAKLTVTLARVSSVAGISAANLASQFTLFLTGAGRITSPLSRFASAVGLTKDAMQKLRAEFKASEKDPVKTAALMDGLTTKLQAFDVAGRLVASSWQGIMSNMTESFELFAGVVTTGLFTNIRDAFLKVSVVDDVFEVLNKDGKVESEKTGAELGDKLASGLADGIIRKKSVVSGALSKIFNLTSTGQFADTKNGIKGFFTEPLQEAILVLEKLYTLIGRDIANVISRISDFIIEIFKWVGDNETTVLKIYDSVKDVLSELVNVGAELLAIFGITGDIDATMSNVIWLLQQISWLLGESADGVHESRKAAIDLEIVLSHIHRWVASVGFWIEAFSKGLVNAGIWVVNLGIKFINLFKTVQNAVKELDYFGALDSSNGWASKIAGWNSQINALTQERNDLTLEGLALEKQRADSLQATLNKQKEIRDVAAHIRKVGITGHPAIGNLPASTGIPLGDPRLNGTDVELYNLKLKADRAFNSAKEESDKKKINEKSSGIGGENTKNSGRALSQTHKTVLDNLFDEQKEYAQKQIEIEQNKVERIADLIRDLMEVQKTSIEDALEQNLTDYASYFLKIAELAESENTTALALLDTETAAIRKQHQINLESFQQDKFNAEAQSKNETDRAVAQAKLKIEYAKIDKKIQTEKMAFEDILVAQASKKAKIERENLKTKLEALRKERDVTIEFYKEVQEARFDLNESLGGFDEASIKTQFDRIAAGSLDAFRKSRAQMNSVKIVGTDREAGDDIIKYARELNDLTIQRVALEFQRLDINTKLAALDREELKNSRILAELDEKRQYGFIGTLEYEKQATEQRAKSIDALRKRLDTLIDSAAKAQITKSAQDEARYTQEAFEARKQLNELYNETDTILLGINDKLRDASKEFLGEILDDVTSVGDAFLKLGKTIQKTFQKALIDRLFQLPAMENAFGDENQTSGKAKGWPAFIGRLMGFGQNKNKKNEMQGGDILQRIADSALAQQGYQKQLTETAEKSLSDLSTTLTAIQKYFQTPIDKLEQLITGKTTITVTAATMEGVDVPKANPLHVMGGGGNSKGSQLRGAALKKAVQNLGMTVTSDFRPNNNDGFLSKHELGKEIYEAVDVRINDITDFMKKGNEEVFARALKGIKAGLRFVEERDRIDPKTGKPSPHLHFESDTNKESSFNSIYGKKKNYFTESQMEQLRAADAERLGLISPPQSTVLSPAVSPPVTPTLDAIQQMKDASGVSTDIPVSINSVSTAAAQTQADALKKTSEAISKEVGDGAPKEDNSSLAQISTQLNTITAALSAGGILDLLKVDVGLIKGLLGGGLALELATFSAAFLGQLTAILSSTVTMPIVVALAANSLKSLASADNISTGEGGTYAYGGYISGPGGPTADKVPAWLSNGEFVVKASAVRALGLDKLHQINNADKELPQFGLGGFIGNIFKKVGQFLTTDMGKLILSTAIPLLAQQFLGEKAANAISMAMPFIFAGLIKPKDAEKSVTDPNITKLWNQATKKKGTHLGIGDMMGTVPGNVGATGGLLADGVIKKFAGGGLIPKHGFLGKPKYINGIPAAEGGFWSSPNGEAVKGGAISAAISIGMALFGRWQANKKKKKELEEYKKNRIKDPFGFNPDTLTSYKKPMITGARNWLAKGGPITSSMMLQNMPALAGGGMPNIDIDEIIRKSSGGESPINLKQNINITTPDVHSFRSSKAQVERDMARMTQRGLRRRAPKY